MQSPEDETEYIALDLSLCEDHAAKIMNGLKQRDLWQFASSDDAGDAIKKFMDRHGILGAGRNKDKEKVPFDPLVEIHMEIIFRTMEGMQEGRMQNGGCPLCAVLNADEWLNLAMNDMAMHFRAKGWLKGMVN